MNRIAKVRKEQGKSQTKIADSLGISRQAISLYERGEREPKLDTWQKLANYFNVPVSYIQGLTDDKDGFDLWEEATGYSKEQLQEGLAKLKKVGALTGDLQKDIGLVVDTNDGRPGGFGDQPALHYVERALTDLQMDAEKKYYLSQEKLSKAPASEKVGTRLILSSENDFGKKYYYDGVDPKVMGIIENVLIDARRLISLAGNAEIHDQKFEHTNIDDVLENLRNNLIKTLNEK